MPAEEATPSIKHLSFFLLTGHGSKVCTYGLSVHDGVAMPTAKPRVTVTLEPEAYSVLVDMAALGKTTPGKVLVDIAGPVLPALKRLVEASKQFAQWQAGLKGQLVDVHKEVTADVDTAIAVLEARMNASGFNPMGGPPPDLLKVPPDASDASAVGAARASMLRSARAVPKASSKPISKRQSGVTPPPYSNTGVKMPQHKQNQRVSKGRIVSTKKGQKSAI
jgi:hypothetical protein